MASCARPISKPDIGRAGAKGQPRLSLISKRLSIAGIQMVGIGKKRLLDDASDARHHADSIRRIPQRVFDAPSLDSA